VLMAVAFDSGEDQSFIPGQIPNWKAGLSEDRGKKGLLTITIYSPGKPESLELYPGNESAFMQHWPGLDGYFDTSKPVPEHFLDLPEALAHARARGADTNKIVSAKLQFWPPEDNQLTGGQDNFGLSWVIWTSSERRFHIPAVPDERPRGRNTLSKSDG